MPLTKNDYQKAFVAAHFKDRQGLLVKAVFYLRRVAPERIVG